MAVETAPHLAVPFTITRQGALTVGEDTPQEKAAAVYNVCVCYEGYRDDNPDFGIRDPTFGPVPVNFAAIEAAILRSEPRADLTTSEQAEAMNQALREMGVEVS